MTTDLQSISTPSKIMTTTPETLFTAREAVTKPSSFFLRLLELTDALRCELEGLPESQSMLSGKVSKEHYAAFLSDLYHIVRHFCPVMAAAASRCPDGYEKLRMHLYHSMEEEKGHEKIVLNDLAAMGVDSATAINSVPSWPVEAMIAYNYYSSDRVHPCCVLGMLYVLELISSVYGGQMAAAIADGLGMQSGPGFSFLDSHATLDLEHLADLRKVLDSIEDPVVQDLVIGAVRMNFKLFILFLRS